MAKYVYEFRYHLLPLIDISSIYMFNFVQLIRSFQVYTTFFRF